MNSSKFEQFLCNSSVLRWSGLTYVLMTAGFVYVMWVWNFQVIDELIVKQQVLDAVSKLDEVQKRVHVWLTATLDVAYPFAYGIFQAGMAYRYLGRWGRYIAPFSLICIPVDLVEGFAQVMILNGQVQYADLKPIVTPIKLLLYVPGLCAALVALCLAGFAREIELQANSKSKKARPRIRT